MIAQWNEVEALFASTYQISSAGEIFDMPWRRFRVLFKGVFSWAGDGDDDGDDGPGQGKLSASVDWSSAKEITADSVPSLIEQFQGKRVYTGKDQ